MFSALIAKIQAVQSLTVASVFRQLFLDHEFTDYIIFLNTRKQLYEQGINSKDERLDQIQTGGQNGRLAEGYSYNTIHGVPGKYQGKIAKGQPIDRITLFDTGEFYESFRCRWVAGDDPGIQITANTIKEGTDLLREWGKDIIGLDDDSIGLLQDMAKKKIREIVRYNLKYAA